MKKLFSKIKFGEWHHLLPVAFILGVIPLIIFGKRIELEGAAFDYWTGASEDFDVFFYWKMVFLVTASCAAFLVFYIRLRTGKITLRKTWLYAVFGLYAVMVYLSTLMSEHRGIAMLGFVSHYEGVFAILSYILLAVILINSVTEKIHIRMLMGTLAVSALIICIIGIFQYFGYDLFKSQLGRAIMLLGQGGSTADIQYTLGRHTIYSTLYHYNFMGSYIAMLFPMSVVFFICSDKRIISIMLGLFSLLMFSNWIGCHSRAGIIGGSLALVILIIVLRRQILVKWIKTVALAAGFVSVFVLMNYASGGDLTSNVNRLTRDIRGVFAEDSEENPLKEITTGDSYIQVVTAKGTIKAVVGDEGISFSDEAGQPAAVVGETRRGAVNYHLEDVKYHEYTFSYNADLRIFEILIPGRIFDFDITSDGVMFIDKSGKLVELEPFGKIDFRGRENLGSDRVYIWSRTIPLLKDTLLLGYGPGNFAIYYPQHDYIGKLNYFGSTDIVVDKPHNMYLQAGINTGLISLLLLLVLFGAYFISSLKLYLFNKEWNTFTITGTANFAAFCGYAAAGFFNDSVVAVAPVFWILFGIGIGINVKAELNINGHMPFSKKHSKI